MKASLITTSKPIAQLVAELDSVFMEDNVVQPVSLSVVDNIDRNDLRAYCHQRAIYTIVTHELISYLCDLVNSNNTIEIGSGNGTLAYGLKIRGTDNKMQDDPLIAMTYMAMGQTTIKYPDFIEKIDAIEAIKKYKPEIVLGSWITHKYREGEGDKGGNYWAPDEEEIMSLCDKYILIGNMGQHKNNRLFNEEKYNHEIFRPSCLRSRATDPRMDAIIIFTKK